MLPSGGQITIQGIPYQFPGSASRMNDNLVPFGQTISLTPGNYRQASLLASASWGPVTGTITIHYTDGSTSNASVTVPDWYNGGPSVALSTPFRYSQNTIDQNRVYIYAISIPLDPTRTADALTLPRTQQFGFFHNSNIHIFSLTMLP
jgi:alpha-L-fucosidase